MKEKVKIWSRRRLLGAFLAFVGLSAMATAQAPWPSLGANGTKNAQCGGQILEVTRTIKQMNEGTEILLNFNEAVTGDIFYLVAEEGGMLDEFVPAGCDIFTDENPLGKNLAVGGFTGQDGAWENATAVGTTIVTTGNTITVKTVTLNNDPSVYYLGIYIQDMADYTPVEGERVNHTTCYSDVYYIKINVLPNIYASLTLNNGNPYEYICNDGTTQTDLGFSLCHLPAGGTLNYKVTANNALDRGVIGGSGEDGVGLQIASTGNTDGTGNPAAVPLVANNPSTASLVITPAQDGTYKVKIGTQQLINNSEAIAGELTFAFTDMTYTYTVREIDANDQERTRTVVLPVIFQTANECGTDGYGDGTNENPYITDSVFTVHVAPAFTITPLQYAEDARTTGKTEFCQGTIAYLNTTTSATEGKITDWVWTVDGESSNTAEAKAKFFPAFNTSDPIQAAITAGTTLEENTAKVGELTKIEEGVYKYDLVATWNDTANHYTGCTANANIDIVVNAAPILLLATDKSGESAEWNTTDQITAPVVCPGNPILMTTNETIAAADDEVAARTQYMNDGNYIKANGATLKYTITLDPTGATAAAYTYWRAHAVTSGTLPLTQTDATGAALDPVQHGHFLNNDGTAPAKIIYTVENSNAPETNGCKLVKSDGSSLNLEAEKDGKVQIIFPVQPRPQFNLDAN